MWPKYTPSGFTQNRSVCSGSRTVMWPATPSSNWKRANRRNAAASRCLRARRSVAKSGMCDLLGRREALGELLGDEVAVAGPAARDVAAVLDDEGVGVVVARAALGQ